MKRFLAGGLLLLSACSGLDGGGGVPLVPPVRDWVAPSAAAGDPERLAAAFPDSAAVRLRLLNAQIQAGDTAKAGQTLAWLTARGHLFSPASRERLRALAAQTGLPDEALANAAHAISASRELASVPAAAQLVESVARDTRRGRLFATTVVSRQLWTRDANGAWSPVPIAKTDSLSGMAIDLQAQLLWVSSANLGMGQGPVDAFHGLIAVDLKTLKEVRRVAAPDGVNPSDLTVGCKGEVFTSDPVGGGIYRARPGGTTLTQLVAPGTLRSPQGLAQSAECRILYVSDYGYGLAAIILDSGRLLSLSGIGNLPVPLDGIDGLWRAGNDLIAVQNGTSPRRILRLGIAYGGAGIARAEVLEQAHPVWTEPLSGSIDGQSLIYVANGQWDSFDKGKPVAGSPPAATNLRILPLRKTNH